jgi:hypothetical protein
VDIGWCQENVKKALSLAWDKRFSCQDGRCPISGAGVLGRRRTQPWFAAIAQLVEHVIRNDGVTGSNPVCGTSHSVKIQP